MKKKTKTALVLCGLFLAGEFISIRGAEEKLSEDLVTFQLFVDQMSPKSANSLCPMTEKFLACYLEKADSLPFNFVNSSTNLWVLEYGSKLLSAKRSNHKSSSQESNSGRDDALDSIELGLHQAERYSQFGRPKLFSLSMNNYLEWLTGPRYFSSLLRILEKDFARHDRVRTPAGQGPDFERYRSLQNRFARLKASL